MFVCFLVQISFQQSYRIVELGPSDKDIGIPYHICNQLIVLIGFDSLLYMVMLKIDMHTFSP